MIAAYRRHAGPFLLAALAVFLPLNVARYPLVAAGWFPAAIGLTFLAHVALVPILRRLMRRRGDPNVPPVVVGRSPLGITVGGFLPSVLLGPAWALLVIGALAPRRERTPSPG